MKSNDPLEFSKYLRHLIEWPESSNVIDYVKRLLGCFSFEKLSIDDVVLSNLTEIKKKKLIERIFEAIEDSDTSPWIIASSKSFKDNLEEKIIDDESKLFTMRRIVESLPMDNKIFMKK